jgi:hypothetical protein
VPTVRRAKLPNRGVRERLCASAGCHASPRAQKSLSAANTGRMTPYGAGIILDACAAVRLRAGESRLLGSRASLNSSCQKTGESNFIGNNAAHCMQRRRQRFPTVRTATQLGNGEVMAKTHDISTCTSTDSWNVANSLEIHVGVLLKSGASRQEKASHCNRNGAATDEHFGDDAVFECCADVNAAGTKHLDSLLDDDGLSTGDETMTHKVRDCTA